MRPRSMLLLIAPPAALAAAVLAALLLPGCGGGGDDRTAVVYKPTGGLQCSRTQTTQARLAAEVAALQAAGVAVAASACANDGVARSAICGIPDGDLFAAEVAASAQAAAMQQGFRPAADYPGAVARDCQ